jgi:hypothetical protein
MHACIAFFSCRWHTLTCLLRVMDFLLTVLRLGINPAVLHHPLTKKPSRGIIRIQYMNQASTSGTKVHEGFYRF